MPAKATDVAIAEATKDTTFLATCFMNLKSKPQVDNVAVAAKLSMSVGGVRNKLRPIIKAMEDAGAVWTANQPATTNRRDGGGDGGGAEKAKSKAAETETKNGLVEERVNGPELVTSEPKSGAPQKTAKSSTKRGHKANDLDVDRQDTTKVQATPKKTAKTTHENVSEQQAEVTQLIKKEY